MFESFRLVKAIPANTCEILIFLQKQGQSFQSGLSRVINSAVIL